MIPPTSILTALNAKLIASPYVGMTAAQMVSQANLQQSQSPKVYADNPVPKSTFTMLIAPALLSLPTLSTQLQAKWQPIITYILGSPDAPVDIAIVGPMLAGAVADGLMTSDQAAAIQAAGQVEVTQSDANVLGYAYLSVEDINAALALTPS